MKTTFKQLTLIVLIVAFSLFSCKQGSKFVYPQDEKISNGSGVPKIRHINYFPIEMAADSTSSAPIDTFHLKLYSNVLFKLGEPILYNFYIGKPVIRLTWIRPSGYAMVLSLEEVNDKIQLKENGFAPMSLIDIAKNPKDTVKRIYRVKTLNFDHKKKLLDLLKKNKFFAMTTNLGTKATKGTELAIEYHDVTNYHLVYRTISDGINPSDFREICDYIIDLSNFKTEKRY